MITREQAQRLRDLGEYLDSYLLTKDEIGTIDPQTEDADESAYLGDLYQRGSEELGRVLASVIDVEEYADIVLGVQKLIESDARELLVFWIDRGRAAMLKEQEERNQPDRIALLGEETMKLLATLGVSK